MLDQDQLSGMAVALVLAGVAVLVIPAAYFTDGRRVYWLWFCLAAIWLLACVVAYGLNPTTFPFRRT
jgi:membrane protein YdbS with pleckstrin-like domain